MKLIRFGHDKTRMRPVCLCGSSYHTLYQGRFGCLRIDDNSTMYTFSAMLHISTKFHYVL